MTYGPESEFATHYTIAPVGTHRMELLIFDVRVRYIDTLLCSLSSFLHAELSVAGVETMCLAIDFTDESDIYERIESALQQLDIAILGTSLVVEF